MIEFRYNNDRGAVAILGAIGDLDLDFEHEPGDGESGWIFVKMTKPEEFDYIWGAFCDSQLPRDEDVWMNDEKRDRQLARIAKHIRAVEAIEGGEWGSAIYPNGEVEHTFTTSDGEFAIGEIMNQVYDIKERG